MRETIDSFKLWFCDLAAWSWGVFFEVLDNLPWDNYLWRFKLFCLRQRRLWLDLAIEICDKYIDTEDKKNDH